MDNYTKKYITDYISSIYSQKRSVLNAELGRVTGQFKKYQALIKYWTYRRNLVSTGDVDNLWIKHFIPSLKPLELRLIPENSEVLDAGSGAGFPGIPIKIMRPDIYLTLCDSNRKRALFLKETVEQLGLKETLVVNDRIENLDKQYDIILSRAMGKPQDIYQRLLRLTKSGGRVFIWTSKFNSEKFCDLKVESFDIPGAGKLLYIENNDIK